MPAAARPVPAVGSPAGARGAAASPTAALVALLLSAAALTGCAGAAPEGDAPVPQEERMNATPIRIMVDGQEIAATIADNPAARSFLEQLPLTLDFSDYGGQEVLAEPPAPLDMAGMPAGESAPAGTIGYYAPDGVVVLYYSDVGRFPGIVRIGEMTGDLSLLRGWQGPRRVAVEIAE